MKNRIDACFEKLKAENKKALVTFITAGDPDMDTTEKCVLEMYKNGSDIIEIGVPFSDPIAEGATIQKASLRSLSGGTNLDKIFDLVRKLRTQTDIAEKSKGFLYVVSSLGVTGMRSEITTDFNELLAPIRNNDHCPCCIGFGISNPEQAKKMSQYADGVIMGSAVVKIVEEHGKDAPEYVGKFIKSVRKGMDS